MFRNHSVYTNWLHESKPVPSAHDCGNAATTPVLSVVVLGVPPLPHLLRSCAPLLLPSISCIVNLWHLKILGKVACTGCACFLSSCSPLCGFSSSHSIQRAFTRPPLTPSSHHSLLTACVLPFTRCPRNIFCSVVPPSVLKQSLHVCQF